MNVLVFGATGGSGRAAVKQLLADGHRVTEFVRNTRMPMHDAESTRLTTVVGDVMNPLDVQRAVEGHDAVIVTLGISENALLVRLRGSRRTPLDVRSRGTRNVILAMRKHHVQKLVVQTSYGVGETRDRLRPADRLVFALLLKPQIEDTELQEEVVRASGLDWVIVQPVHLTNDPDADDAFVSDKGDVREMRISRASVGRVLARAVARDDLTGRSLAVSGLGDTSSVPEAARIESLV